MKSFFCISILSLALCFVGCKHADAPTTPQATPKAESEVTVQETNEAPKEDLNFSTVQVVDSKRFTDEVCEFADGKYGFKCNKPVIIDFYANWCGPCTQIAPFLAEFAEKYAGEIIIYKVNIDNSPDIANAFKIESIPTLVFVNPKTQPIKIVGAMPKDKLEQNIKKLLLE
ncbi:MAG: thioredoxin [Bacteroidales bacterium]|nr:thioredoxin [Bacteroidales bacterium]